MVSGLLGEINLLNILGASALSAALGIDGAAVAEGVRRCSGAPGRLEAVTARKGITALVDYAHKPDALEAVLATLRPLTRGRLICVFGCGGDRDRGKRPIMGEIAGRLADLADSHFRQSAQRRPARDHRRGRGRTDRRGTPAHRGIPRANPLSDKRGYLVEPDRRRAIAIALKLARPGDVVLIAGKGHEDYQLVGDRVLKFDDREVVRELAAELDG